VGRQTATVLGLRQFRQRAEHGSRSGPILAWFLHYNLLIYKEKERAGRKPGSVVDNHSSGTAVTDCLKQPTREPAQARGRGSKASLLPYLVLLQAGFTVPRSVTTRAVRSYRTFSPLPAKLAVYFLWHFPWVRTLQALPGALPDGARTFLRIPWNPAIAWPTLTF